MYSYCLYVLISSKNTTFRHAFYDLFRIGGNPPSYSNPLPAVSDITLLLAIIFMRMRKRVGLC